MKRILIRLPALAIFLAAGGLLSCAEQKEKALPANTGKVELALGTNESLPSGAKVAVYAFKNDGSGRYCYSRAVAENWDGTGISTLFLPEGEYKFHYSCCDKSGLALDPTPDESTEIEMLGYRTLLSENGGECLPCSELFLPKVDSKPDSVYKIGSVPTKVKVDMERVVSRVDVVLKQGRLVGTEYVPVPLPSGSTALDRIGSIRLKVSGAGQRVCGTGTSGSAVHSGTLDAEDCVSVSPEGFMLLKGPMILPPPSDSEVTVDVWVLPATKTAKEFLAGTFHSRLPKNTRLELTLWLISSADVGVDVTVDLKPLVRFEEGETGIWD